MGRNPHSLLFAAVLMSLAGAIACCRTQELDNKQNRSCVDRSSVIVSLSPQVSKGQRRAFCEEYAAPSLEMPDVLRTSEQGQAINAKVDNEVYGCLVDGSDAAQLVELQNRPEVSSIQVAERSLFFNILLKSSLSSATMNLVHYKHTWFMPSWYLRYNCFRLCYRQRGTEEHTLECL